MNTLLMIIAVASMPNEYVLYSPDQTNKVEFHVATPRFLRITNQNGVTFAREIPLAERHGDYGFEMYALTEGRDEVGLSAYAAEPFAEWDIAGTLHEFEWEKINLNGYNIPIGGIELTPVFYPRFPGDSNDDLVFDSSDLVTIFKAGQYEDSISDNSTWVEGDWNGDLDFNSKDLIYAFSNASYDNSPASAVPEPSSLLLILYVFLIKRTKS